MSILFYTGLLLICGLLFGRLAKLVGLPNVTGYLIAGLIIGPYVLGVVSFEAVDSINIVSEMALAFIALSIGSEFKLSYLKELGITPFIIALVQGVLAIVFVTTGLVALGFDFSISLMLGAIASATAPAATVMVIKQYRAKGPVTRTLLSVVAIDDAIALIAFGFVVTYIKTMKAGSDNIVMSVLDPFIELGISVLIGVIFSLALTALLHFFKKDSNRICAIVGILFAVSAVAGYFRASSLLVCMMLGAIFVNISKDAVPVFKITDIATPPILMLFFVISGAKLEILLIPSIGIIGIIYVVMRVVGKVFGTWLGAVITKSPETVKKYMGWTMIPQAGVAIGLTLVVDKVLPEYAGQVRAVVLCATLIYELVGPVATKLSLKKAGEISE